jgi:hypothetical protein
MTTVMVLALVSLHPLQHPPDFHAVGIDTDVVVCNGEGCCDHNQTVALRSLRDRHFVTRGAVGSNCFGPHAENHEVLLLRTMTMTPSAE